MVYQVAQAAAQPVQFPDSEGVAGLERGKATGEGRALLDRAAYALILEYLCASGFFERGHLQGGRLVVGGCSRIAYFHAPILRLTYATSKPLISWT